MCIQVELHSLHCHIHHAGVKASQQKTRLNNQPMNTMNTL